MTKNIYTELGFSALGNTIFPDVIIDEAKTIFSALPLKIVSIRNLIIEQTVAEETYAISTAEDSELTEKEAAGIMLTQEVEARLLKYKNDTSSTDRQKYDRLEFENIESVEVNLNPMGFEDLTIGFIKKLHYDLTIGLDEYGKKVGVSSYNPGRLRDSNNIKVGKIRSYQPPDYRKILRLLRLLLAEFKRRKGIMLKDILEFHVLLYAIHPFSNGNKRVVRVLESILLHYYGYGAERTLSLASFYRHKRDESHFFLIESLRRKNPASFVDFALRGYLQSGNNLFDFAIQKYLFDYNNRFVDLLKLSIKESKRTQYKNALSAIRDLGGVFTHGEFIKRMKKYRYTLGVSQMVLLHLKTEGFLQHKGAQYFIPNMPEIFEGKKQLVKFFIKNGIVLEG